MENKLCIREQTVSASMCHVLVSHRKLGNIVSSRALYSETLCMFSHLLGEIFCAATLKDSSNSVLEISFLYFKSL